MTILVRARLFSLVSPPVKPHHIGYALLLAALLAFVVWVMWLSNGHW